MQQNAMESCETEPSSEKKLIDEIREYLDVLEKRKIYYPFKYEKIFSLYGLKDTEDGKKLIREKKDILLRMIEAIDQEKEGGLWAASETNRDMETVIRELTEKKLEVL